MKHGMDLRSVFASTVLKSQGKLALRHEFSKVLPLRIQRGKKLIVSSCQRLDGSGEEK